MARSTGSPSRKVSSSSRAIRWSRLIRGRSRQTLDQAKAKKAQDEASLANANLDLQRFTKLGEFATGSKPITQRSTVAQLTAQIEADTAAIFNAQTQLDYATIKAPFSGVAGLRQVDVGNIVNAATQTGIVTIAQIEPIAVIFTAPEDQLPEIKAALARTNEPGAGRTTDCERSLDLGQLIFGCGEDHRDRLDLRNGHDAGLGCGIDDVADIDLAKARDAGERRLDGGVVELGLRIENGCRVGLDLRRQLRDGGALGIGLLPGCEFAELGKALQIEIGVGETGFVLGFLGLGLIERRLERPRINLDQRIALLDELTFLEGDPVDLAIDAGADQDSIKALHGAKAGQIDREIGLLDGRGLDGHAGRCALLGTGRLRGVFLAMETLPAEIAEPGHCTDQQ